MEVFLVPVGAARDELYCEVPDEPHDQADADPEPAGGNFVVRWFRGLKRRFRQMLAEAERERRHGRSDREHRGWLGRLHARIMRWVAESIAEQRLLWHLRGQTAATFYYPDDLAEALAVSIRTKRITADFEKHRFWLAIDSLAFVASGLLMLVPGPNLLAYFFAFRLVGHDLSLRGARQGLDAVAWTNVPSAPLAALRTAVHLEPDQREQKVHDVAAALRLEHLAKFFERTAIPTA